MDIAMLFLVPVGLFLVVLVALALLWRWETSADRGWVSAIAFGVSTAWTAGYFIYRFGFGGAGLLMIGLIPFSMASGFFATKWTVEATRDLNEHSINPKAGTPRDTVVLVAAFLIMGAVVWFFLR